MTPSQKMKIFWLFYYLPAWGQRFILVDTKSVLNGTLWVTLICMEMLKRRVKRTMHRALLARQACGYLLALWCCALALPSLAQSVVFINPGKSDEAYWVASSEVMQQAADSLGMQLRVLYAQRERFAPLAMAQALAQLPVEERPDYVIFSNDYSTAPSILKVLDGSGIQAFMAFSGVPDTLKAQVGAPRERYPFWLGSLEPNAADAGYLTAKALIQKGRKIPSLQDKQGRLHMVAIAGDRSTPASVARNQGMRKAVEEAAGTVILHQEVYGEWRTDKAMEQAQVLFQRYPEVRLVWSGNDLMAFGAMAAWRQRGGTPGQDALFSGVNTSAKAFELLRSGALSALAGGHFMAGAWAMVMLYDHYHGVDFVSEGLELQRDMFWLFTAENSRKFERRFAHAAEGLDFRPFSKHLNPTVTSYQFELGRLLR